MKRSIMAQACAVIFLLVSAMPDAAAQEGSQDPLARLIWQMFQMHQGKTLCADGSASLHMVQTNVIDYLKAKGTSENATSQAVATALWTLYPCPFSPARSDLRPATREDIEGVWIFPETSQKFRFGPKMNRQSPAGPVPVKCDAVGYYPNGELRHAMSAGRQNCPFEKSADLDPARKNPRVSDWALLREGRIGITRADVFNHIEEWDVYVVTAPFSMNDVQFSNGDIVAYLRRENGNEVGASTQFRHLQRLP
jgi:hypothetical protein